MIIIGNKIAYCFGILVRQFGRRSSFLLFQGRAQPRMLDVITKKKFKSYELKSSPFNQELTYGWPKYWFGGEIFSYLNVFSWLSEITFFQRCRCKKYYKIILYIVIMIIQLFYLLKILIKQLFFYLEFSIEDIITVFCCLLIPDRCRTPTKHVRIQALIPYLL